MHRESHPDESVHPLARGPQGRPLPELCDAARALAEKAESVPLRVPLDADVLHEQIQSLRDKLAWTRPVGAAEQKQVSDSLDALDRASARVEERLEQVSSQSA
jgi:hypothetical protein